MYENFVNKVVKFYKDDDWKSIINLNKNSDNEEACKLLWIWPSEENLKFIKNILDKFNLNGIISLGCGCGLLEWIIKCYTDKNVIGYEVNREWWDSKYSNPKFIPLTYPSLPIKKSLSGNYALLFCYFNNGPAFQEYVEHYDGNVLFIIGPGKGRGTHTNPQPFCPEFQCNEWTLFKYEEVKNSKDFIAVYVRTNQYYIN